MNSGCGFSLELGIGFACYSVPTQLEPSGHRGLVDQKTISCGGESIEFFAAKRPKGNQWSRGEGDTHDSCNAVAATIARGKFDKSLKKTPIVWFAKRCDRKSSITKKPSARQNVRISKILTCCHAALRFNPVDVLEHVSGPLAFASKVI